MPGVFTAFPGNEYSPSLIHDSCLTGNISILRGEIATAGSECAPWTTVRCRSSKDDGLRPTVFAGNDEYDGSRPTTVDELPVVLETSPEAIYS
jgi:hypothetical protein